MKPHLHKLVERQIRKYIPNLNMDDSLQSFVHAISESYYAYERDKEIDSHAFAISEKEYNEINKLLKEEIDAKKISINKLKDTLSHLDEYTDFNFSDDNLVSIVDYLRMQIHNRKIVETELIKNVTRISSLISNLHSGLLVENEDRQIIFTNETFCKMFDIPVSPTQLIGQDCSQSAEQTKHIFKDPESFVHRINTILLERKQVEGDVLELVDGRIFERDFIPVFVENDYRGHMWNYSDITQKKKILDAVAESEKKNRLIMDSALDAIIAIDDKGLIITWNPQAERLFGWKEADVKGKKLADIIIPERYRIAHEKGMAHYNKTGDGKILKKLLELNALNKEGEEFPVELSITPISFENTTFFCSFIRDISERKKSENILIAKEEKYRSIIANINLGLLEVDTEDRIQMANQSFCRMSGYELDELINEKASRLFVVGEHEELIIEKQKLRQDGVSDAYEIAVLNKKKEIKWWLVSGAPRYNDKGELVGSIGIHLDITEQKNLEKELVEAIEIAEQSSKAKENFLANMSHEIRTPLNAIIGFTQQLEESALNAQQQSYIETINKASENLLIIINDILDITKVEAGKLKIESIPFDIRELVTRIMYLFSHKSREKGLSLTCQVDEKIKSLHVGDPYRINQILTNLINNAIKFTAKGFVRIEVKLLHEFENIQEIQVSIIDSGKGMSVAFIDKIFQKFTQENSSIARTYGGVGLGMSIVKELTTLLHGSIQIQSKENEGTQVNISIPLEVCEQESIEETQQQALNLNQFNGIKVLLVEDNEMNRFLANIILNEANMIVEEAVNGDEAIQKMRQDQYDIVLMDMQMPIKGGIETTIDIRKHINSTVPIIALTANAIYGEKEKCLLSGMNDYLTKPFKKQELYEIIAKWTLKEYKPILTTSTNKEPILITSELLYNLDILHQLGNNDSEFISKMIAIFKEQASQFMIDLEKAIQENDRAQIHFIAHKIKPSINNLGIQSLQKPILKLELESIILTHKELVELNNFCQKVLTEALQTL